jgi:DNA-binding transcriptional regulator GbsR (MarR family)
VTEELDDDERAQRASDLAADAIGTLVEFWGFKRILGRLWVVLYMAPKPLTMKDLATRLRVSPSLVSMALNELLLWGAVRRPPRPGGRADVYEAETNLWKMISKVIKERERFRLDDALERLAAAKTELGPTGGRGPEATRRKKVQARIEKLERLSLIIKGLIDVLLEEGTVDISGLREISLGSEDDVR